MPGPSPTQLARLWDPKKTKLVSSPDQQPRKVRFGKRYAIPVVFFRYTIGYSFTLFLALYPEAAFKSMQAQAEQQAHAEHEQARANFGEFSDFG